MDISHMKKVAERNAHKSEMEFRRYMARCGWSDEEIVRMWKMVQKKEVQDEES